ncbi:MAG: sugar phosphate isomerase/epimerase [Clostridia bacterium]|nr:sugar phosphate isomerase/epimerase [Clostridia bacterium]MBQ9793299.1 sugar phosphate isomerase/epimerase [Clostridia bacterium]
MIGIYDVDKVCNINYKERLDIYKQVGFNEVALYLDNNYLNEDENYTNIILYAKKIGLKVKQVHIDYKISNLICDETTSTYFDYLEEKLNEAIKLDIPYIVAHASMSAEPPILNDKQLNKLKNLLKKYEGNNVCVCFENVRNNTNLDKILKLSLDNIGFCFDLGHAHCYSNPLELFEKHFNKIKCSHLHNNFGKDTHNILTNGDIDYKYYLEKLKTINDASNCLECFPEYGVKLNKEEFISFVKNCFLSVN